MIITIIGVIVAYYIVSVITESICNFFNRHGKGENGPTVFGPDTKYEPSNYDKEMIEESKEIVRELFPDGVLNSIINLSTEERIEKIKEMTLKISQCYDIDITAIEFLTVEELMERGQSAGTCGYYENSTQSIVFNLDMLACNDLNMLREAVDTAIHECRHAFQYKAVTQSGFGKVDAERVEQWAINFVRYISSGIDPKGYYYQALEFDARNFAAMVLSD